MNQTCVTHAMLTASVFEDGRSKLIIDRDNASSHHKESRRMTLIVSQKRESIRKMIFE